MKWLWMILIVLLPGVAFAPPVGKQAVISEATPRRLVYEVCRRESHFEPVVIGDEGQSVGPCQIKHSTAVEAGYRGREWQLFNPSEAAIAAGGILRHYKDICGSWVAATECYRHGPKAAKIKGRRCRDYPKNSPVRWICQSWKIEELRRM